MNSQTITSVLTFATSAISAFGPAIVAAALDHLRSNGMTDEQEKEATLGFDAETLAFLEAEKAKLAAPIAGVN